MKGGDREEVVGHSSQNTHTHIYIYIHTHKNEKQTITQNQTYNKKHTQTHLTAHSGLRSTASPSLDALPTPLDYRAPLPLSEERVSARQVHAVGSAKGHGNKGRREAVLLGAGPPQRGARTAARVAADSVRLSAAEAASSPMKGTEAA